MSAAPPILQQLKDRITRHEALLKKIEFVSSNCPSCGGLFLDGHKENCELRALMEES